MESYVTFSTKARKQFKFTISPIKLPAVTLELYIFAIPIPAGIVIVLISNIRV